MENYSWQCPYCNQHATMTDQNISIGQHRFNHGNKDGNLILQTEIHVCPNPDCRQYTIFGALYGACHDRLYNIWKINSDSKLSTWNLRQNSLAKQFPDYVPETIIADYNEACLIKDLSPKASATLSRRCLQGMIRDYWNIKKKSLYEEIQAIKDKTDPDTWGAIDAVRTIGNIGAHMEKDINVIIDVDSNEAQLLINLIETLVQDWYIARHERKKRLQNIVDIAAQKQEAKGGRHDGQTETG
ncbi:MAG: DUF4145 domain-containing protein [Magnetococcus sp. YQC-3]